VSDLLQLNGADEFDELIWKFPWQSIIREVTPIPRQCTKISPQRLNRDEMLLKKNAKLCNQSSGTGGGGCSGSGSGS
jgi:hypothetical protein